MLVDNEQIKQLFLRRFLDHDVDDMEVLETVMNDIAINGSNEIIKEICAIFHDDIEPYIISDLIEAIFYIAEREGAVEGLYNVLESIPNMLPHAKFSIKQLLKTLLNSNELLDPFTKVIKKIDNETFEIAKELLIEIKRKQPDRYLDKVDSILLKSE